MMTYSKTLPKAARNVVFVCATVTVAAYVVLGTPGIDHTVGWSVFGLHLSAALCGVLAGGIALLGKRWSAIVPMMICAYVILFQTTTLVPAPTFLMWL
jgi:hypothetical protein